MSYLINPYLFAGELITATGGTITTDGDYKVHTFNASGDFEITAGSGDVEYLIIAGGGGSTSNWVSRAVVELVDI